MRRLTLLAEGADGREEIFRGLARELLQGPGGDELHVHCLLDAFAEEELVVVYLFAGEGRLSYLAPRAERPAGISWVANTGRSFLAADARELQASLPRLAETGHAGCALLLPLAVAGEVEAVVVLVRRESTRPYDGRAIELASTLADQAATALALVRARAEAGTDPVTGCMNHRAMRRRLQEEIGRAVRTGAPLSCLLIDLDNFKLVNDRHGHAAGDTVLREVAHALVGEFRAFDRVARYGGDEFVVILAGADLDSAAAAAARAVQRLRELPSRESSPGEPPSPESSPHEPSSRESYPREPSRHDISTGLGASVGVAQWSVPMDAAALLASCDAALLRSKREGKGRVTRASAPVA